MAPIGNAVRFVDDQHRDLCGDAGQNLRAEAFVRQALGRDQENVDFPMSQLAFDLGPVIDVVGVDRGGANAHALRRGDLVQQQRPALIISHNKTLAAQLYSEFKNFFPENAVEYFVSYYDYYQPEAYVPSTDTFIEKDSAINEDIERLRISASSGEIRSAGPLPPSRNSFVAMK